MIIVTHTVAARMLRAGQAVMIRRRGEPLTLSPPGAVSSPSSAPGYALVWWDRLPTLVRVSRIVPGQYVRAVVPMAPSWGYGGRRASHQSVEVEWSRVLGVGRGWRIADFIV